MSINFELNKNLTVKDYVYILCKLKGLNFKQLSNNLGIKQSYIYKDLSESMDISLLKQIIDYLDGDFNIVIGLLPNQTLILDKKNRKEFQSNL